MTRLISPAVEVEYDFSLMFRGDSGCPYRNGDLIKSGTTDDLGQRVEFVGSARVVSVITSARIGQTTTELLIPKRL